MTEKIRIMTFSDWHTQPIEPLVAEMEERTPDLVLYAGNSTGRFWPLNPDLGIAKTHPVPVIILVGRKGGQTMYGKATYPHQQKKDIRVVA